MKKPLVSFLFLLTALSLSAQTAAELDVLLEIKEVTAAKAARFVMGAAGLLPEELSGAAAETVAYNTARSKGWLRRGAADSVSLKETAFLVMNVFEFKGGIMYSLFRNPRYAYREAVYRKLIPKRDDPSMTVSGTALLQIIDRSLDFSGEDDRLETEQQAASAMQNPPVEQADGDDP